MTQDNPTASHKSSSPLTHSGKGRNMNEIRLKIVCIVLGLALVVALTRIFVLAHAVYSAEPAQATADVVMQNILQRKSVRSYTDQAVRRESLDTLVRAAMAAPTGKDMRPWKFVIIDDKETMQSLAEYLPRAKMLAEAQAAVVVCGDLTIKDNEGKSSRLWEMDCSAATENLLLQAEAMGLGAVWTAVYPYEDRTTPVANLLNLPDSIKPFSLVPIGYPKGDPKPKDKYTQDNVHYNVW